MQQGISIHDFAARYRLPASAADQRRRLDQALGEVMEWALEDALERGGVPTAGELCIRNIYSMVNLRLSGTDRSLALAWSEALAQSIKRGMEGAQVSDVAHYSSRVQALIDLAVGVSLGDLERAWAWKQIGLWSAGHAANDAGRVSGREAMLELVRTLVREPALIVPVLRALAEMRLLERLAARFSTEQWTTLASAALLIVSSSLPLDHLVVRVDQNTARDAAVSATLPREARRLVSASILAQPLAAGATTSAQIDLGEIAHAEVARALAILTILDANPVTFRAGSEMARAKTVAVAHQCLPDWFRAGAGPDASPKELQLSARSAESDTIKDVPLTALKNGVSARILSPENVRLETKTSTRAGAFERDIRSTREFYDQQITAQKDRQKVEYRSEAPAGKRKAAAHTTDADAEEIDTGANEIDTGAEKIDADASAFDLAVDQRPIPAVRKRGFTTFGGLFFLLAVVEDLGLPELILAQEVLLERSFRWTMQRMALALVPAEPNDAGVLAFAGLAPGAASPAEREEPASEDEDNVIAEFKIRIVENLRERLKRPDEGATELLQFVCERRAEIVTDPGWIEIHLSLDEVSTEIRRSGLDLDPGYLAWLGVVVKFIYE